MLVYAIKKLPLISEDNYPVILTGGGALLKGLTSFCKAHLNPLTRDALDINTPYKLESASHSAALGMIKYAIKTSAISYTHITPTLKRRIQSWITRLK